MEKAILKTLIYSNIFDYPLTLSEIHKWLIGRKTTPREVEKTLKVLKSKRKISSKKDFFFLRGNEQMVNKRIRKAKQSAIYKAKVKVISQFLKIIPWVKLVGISGGLSMENADKRDDIDLIIITSKNRVWLSRLLVLGFLNILGQRRKVEHSLKEASGKICCNIFLEEDNLIQKRKDLYTAHEVLQMKVIWERENIYSKFLEDNDWVFKFLPNWISDRQGSFTGSRLVSSQPHSISSHSLPPFSLLEILSKNLQLKIMQKPKGMERVEEGALYFHPNDIREYILKTFKEKTQRLEN